MHGERKSLEKEREREREREKQKEEKTGERKRNWVKKNLEREEKKERERERERESGRDEKEKKPTASHPSMKGQRPQERWIGVTGNHRRPTHYPEPSFRLWSVLLVTGVLAVGRVIKNRYMYGVAQTPTRLFEGKCSEPQSASEHATSTSHQNRVQIQYLNPCPVVCAGETGSSSVHSAVLFVFWCTAPLQGNMGSTTCWPSG